ncbi:MAG: hypothetical protein ACO3DQ_07610 [Cephaloticoccus sp.]
MMRFQWLTGALALAACLAMPGSLSAQRTDSHTWKLGLQAGAMIVQTATQDSEVIPSFGAHVLVMAKRGGLLVGVDEGFGSDERSGLILFNDVRRYQAVLMAFPVNAPLEPYIGLGGGILQVVGPRVDDAVTDPFDRRELADAAEEANAHAFVTALAGVQGHWGRLTAFAQAQIGSSPNRDRLFRGALYSVHGGIRIGLGSAKEGGRAGGY